LAEEDLEAEEEIEEVIDLVEEIDNTEDHIIEITTEDLNLKTVASIVIKLVTLQDNVQNQDKIMDLEEEEVEEEDMKEEIMVMIIEEISMNEEEADQEV
jgi:hypothetical protein